MAERVAQEDLAALRAYLESLGAADSDIERAAALGGLGPLALDLAIRPDGEAETLEQFAQRSGIAPEVVRRHWTALGLPLDPPFPFPVTRDIATAIEVMVFLGGAIGVEATLDFARVLGSTAARLADALAEATRMTVEVPQLASGASYSDVVATYSRQGRELLPTLIEVIAAAFRRHLILVSYQLWSPDEANTTVTMQRAVCFADLVGSTGAIRDAPPAEVARLVRGFERRVWDAVNAEGGRMVKLIGDEAMFAFEDAATALAVAERLLRDSPQPLRAGIDFGPVVALGGDYYGRTVNLAARLVAAAPPGCALVSTTVRDAVGGDRLEPSGTSVRDFPDVPAFLLRVEPD